MKEVQDFRKRLTPDLVSLHILEVDPMVVAIIRATASIEFDDGQAKVRVESPELGSTVTPIYPRMPSREYSVMKR